MRALLATSTALALLLTAANTALADETKVTTESQTGIAVTIYNQDLALIRDSRKIKVTAGENDIAFVDVSAAMRPETALLNAAGDSISVIEQNFDFDLLTPQKLLEKSVGQKIRVFRTNPETGEDRSEEAEVLSVAEGQVVLKIGDRIETAIPGRLVYSAVPENLRARPTLVIKTQAEKSGEIPVDLSYLSRGLAWSADYVADLSADEKSVNINGLVTLTNQSGITYNNAKLQLVAGNVNQVQQYMGLSRSEAPEMVASGMAPPVMTEQAAFEYHLYNLERPTTIKENQTKQVAMLAAENVPVEKQYLFTNPTNIWSSYSYNFGEAPRKNAQVNLKFQNDEKSHMGMPLPAGVIRVYKKDNNNALFVGEDRIDHTPKNERVDLTLGEAFDITARAKQVDYSKISNSIYENAYEIEIKNAKKEKVTVDIREGIPGEWKILDESQEHKKLDSSTAQWLVDVPAEGSTVLKYSVRVKF